MPTSQLLNGNQPLTPTTPMDHNVPSSPQVAASVSLPDGEPEAVTSPPQTINVFSKASMLNLPGAPHEGGKVGKAAKLELKDGTTYLGVGFGADKSVSGELVFQTGMVGYPESITDPSYKGQILVITFPLVGNYGVPSRDTMDEMLGDLPTHFEANQIHVSGLVVASYAGEDYSHHLATSSLGTWLREQGIPAMYGVDTRALTKRIREEGSMLGKMVIEAENQVNGMVNGDTGQNEYSKMPSFEDVEWDDPNKKNLVLDGEIALAADPPFVRFVEVFCQSLSRNLVFTLHQQRTHWSIRLVDQSEFSALTLVSSTISFVALFPEEWRSWLSLGTMIFQVLLAKTTTVSSSPMGLEILPYLQRLCSISQLLCKKPGPLFSQFAWVISFLPELQERERSR